MEIELWRDIMFKEEREEPMFDWGLLGDIDLGRPNLGSTMPVVVYRLMQFTLRDNMIKQFGVKKADEIFYQAGKVAGQEVYKNLVNETDDFNNFVSQIQSILKNLGIGVLRIEKADLNNLNFLLTVSEDLDCSGLPVCEEEICVYDEGFIAGLLLEQTGREFMVKEIDCWCSGDRVCRFEAKVK